MKKYIRQYSSALVIPFFLTGLSCSSYSELIITHKTRLPAELEASDPHHRISGISLSAAVSRKKKTALQVTKFLAGEKGFSPESLIMSHAVNEALKGNYFEAEALFREIQNSITDGSVENNLGVVYELTERKKDAMAMYTNALIKSPENAKFRKNMLTFINFNKYRMSAGNSSSN